MTFEDFENLFALFCTIIGIISSLFKFIEFPKRRYIYLIIFFMAHFFSDYYWAIYVLTMHSEPNVSGFMANIGWNIGYVFLFLSVFHWRRESRKRRKYFNPLMLWPLLTNIPLFILFIQFGGILNNIWQVGITTSVMILCTKDLLYYHHNKKAGLHFPRLHFLILLFLIFEYSMWAASCFEWVHELLNPYFYFTILASLCSAFFAWAAEKDYQVKGQLVINKNEGEIRLQTLLQTLAAFVIIGDCVVGYFIAVVMRNRIPNLNVAAEAADSIVSMLFLISIILIFVIMFLLHEIAFRYRVAKTRKKELDAGKLSRLNFICTISITLILMAVAVIYNAKILHDTGLFEDIHSKLVVNILISLLSFSLVSFFYYLGYKNERNYGKKVEEMNLQVVSALASAIDAKDAYTNGHSARVAEYSRMIAKRLGYSESKQDDIYMMGLLHDIGKIGVPDEVINKTGRLTDEEFMLIKKHPEIGSNILKTIKERPELSIGARWHHERFAGGGYPDGIAGEEIPEEARIIAVADAYDAMTSSRSYRELMPQSKVRSEIEKGIGTQFDPKFAAVMLQMIDEDKDYTMCGK